MAHVHTEWPETERPGVPHVGYIDPHEQTLSDDEIEPVRVEPYVPIEKRWHRWRLFYDAEHGHWHAAQPEQLGYPFFSKTSGTTTIRGYAYVHPSGARALHELQLAIAKYEAAL